MHAATLTLYKPSISLDGKVVGPLLLCLQEINGKMGETVKKNYSSRLTLSLRALRLEN